jgi:hypothetical protein
MGISCVVDTAYPLPGGWKAQGREGKEVFFV